ncbi:MAG: hypothetical protein NVSMB52_00520 [Chloroflexota bacterium]
MRYTRYSTRCTVAAIFVLSMVLSPPPAQASRNGVHHYLYVTRDGTLSIFDIDRGHRLVNTVSLPQTNGGIRGIAASPKTHSLFISYGPDNGPVHPGSLLRFDLVKNRVVWARSYSHGIDSMAVTPNGKTIYMPDGELSPDGLWYVIDARTGHEVGRIDAGRGPHNTIVSPRGSRVYLGGRNYPYLDIVNTKTNRIIRKVGPLRSGVRPFTINGRGTLAYISVTGFLGFQVGDLTTGTVLYTVPIRGYTWDASTFSASDPSHGISLSPDEKELYVIDAPNSIVHVFDVRHVPSAAPKQVADIHLNHPMTGPESQCAYDCERGGWLVHSRNGRFVYVGDSGDIIDTRTRKVVAFLDDLYNTKKFLEIDFKNGVPISTTTRSGMGYRHS